MNVGIDSIEISRIEKCMSNQRFVKRVFSEDEQKIIGISQSAAANFCVKEAFSKALGTGVRGFSLNEVSTLRNEFGAPYVVLSGRAQELFGKMGFKEISVSITHTKELATAIIILN